jgi:lysophospholipid acyltransferase (LPLAT)-like uncharacterized protein
MNAETSPAPLASRSPGASGAPVTPHRPTFRQRAAARLIHLLIQAIALTLRYRWERDPRGIVPSERPYIFCVWHNRLALSLVMYRQYAKSVGLPPRLAGLVSASRDGALLSQVLKLFKVEPVRGSSSRRGAQALLELASWLDRGYDTAITVDGPRGPRYQVKLGVIGLAQVSGRSIVPASFRLSRKWTIKSWDRFQIPLPFATCYFDFAEPVQVPREISDEQRETMRQELESRLRSLTRD